MTQTLIEKLEGLPRYDQIEGWIHPDDNALERIDDGEYVEYRRVRAIIDQYKTEEVVMSFDLAKGLNHVADNGFWPNVLFDDNGNWCIADEGSSNVRMDDDQDFSCGLIGEASWFKPSLKEAWYCYMQRLIDFGNTTIDKNCAESPSPAIVAELVKALGDAKQAVIVASDHYYDQNNMPIANKYNQMLSDIEALLTKARRAVKHE